jgi:hypothetical protein
VLEARAAIGIEREGLREDLDRHVAVEARITRAIHFAHSAFAQLPANLERPDPGADL